MNGRTTSIARRIAWRLQAGKLWRIFFQSLVLFLTAVVSWCAGAAIALDVSLSTLPRWNVITSGEGLLFIDISHALHLLSSGGSNRYAHAVVIDMAGTQAVMGEFLFWLENILLVLTLYRLFCWCFGCLQATNHIRRYLRPIDDIAQVTESISSHGFEESKFHSLEEAIDHLNGASSDEQIHVGDGDLAGLETAVNNLIARMHAGYREQVRFVDDASHELRTPIAVIQGYADMLARWGKSDEKVLNESILAIQTEAAHMKVLVDQLLFLARGDSGRQELRMENMDLAELVREITEESKMIDPNHKYSLDAQSAVAIRGDHAFLKQAIRVLVENAEKYSPPGSRITLRAYMDGQNACADVQDNGIGISAEDAPKIFDRFFRSKTARETSAEGSGLGLSIARWIINRHGGRFQVRSYEGVGTRITIVLPSVSARTSVEKSPP